MLFCFVLLGLFYCSRLIHALSAFIATFALDNWPRLILLFFLSFYFSSLFVRVSLPCISNMPRLYRLASQLDDWH